MWYLCSCGFGLLFYGFGSKKTLLEDFANSALVDGAAIVVNGYLPSVNIKHVSIYLVLQISGSNAETWKRFALVEIQNIGSRKMGVMLDVTFDH
jgi:hypothetical protein